MLCNCLVKSEYESYTWTVWTVESVPRLFCLDALPLCSELRFPILAITLFAQSLVQYRVVPASLKLSAPLPSRALRPKCTETKKFFDTFYGHYSPCVTFMFRFH